jgi:hydrogenase maturation protease
VSEKPILIAGIGNIFFGDDAFGVEVVQRLARRPLPPEVEVLDFGIRGLDLSYALLDGCRAAILVDTTCQGGRPGTLYVIEPEPELPSEPSFQDMSISPHHMDIASTLRLVSTLGGACRQIVLVACEPTSFGPEEEGRMGLSEPVLAAVDKAVGLIEFMVQRMLKEMQ